MNLYVCLSLEFDALCSPCLFFYENTTLFPVDIKEHFYVLRTVTLCLPCMFQIFLPWFIVYNGFNRREY